MKNVCGSIKIEFRSIQFPQKLIYMSNAFRSSFSSQIFATNEKIVMDSELFGPTWREEDITSAPLAPNSLSIPFHSIALQTSIPSSLRAVN